jgi:hypothetical protein
MKKLISILLAVLVVAMISAVGVFAQDENPNASAKATSAVTGIVVVDSDDYPKAKILENTIKTSNKKDLFIDVSLQCGLYTQTKTTAKTGGGKDKSTAQATITVYVEVDGHTVYPANAVVFADRYQELSQELRANLAPGEWVESDIELILRTMNANSFNFIVTDLDSGTHTVTVYGEIGTTATSGSGTASALGTIGMGSVTIEEVRMVQNDDITLY